MGQCLHHTVDTPSVSTADCADEPEWGPQQQEIQSKPRPVDLAATQLAIALLPRRSLFSDSGDTDREGEATVIADSQSGMTTPRTVVALDANGAAAPDTATTPERTPPGKRKAASAAAFRSILPPPPPPEPAHEPLVSTPLGHPALSPVAHGSPFSPGGAGSPHRARSAVVRIEESVHISVSAFESCGGATEDALPDAVGGSPFLTSLGHQVDAAAAPMDTGTWLRSVPLIDAGTHRNALARPHTSAE